jgi:hypothetical protein
MDIFAKLKRYGFWIMDKFVKLKCYGFENWKQILINLFVEMIVAIISILAVLWVFNKEIDRSRLIERKTYERNFVMVLSEAGNNLAKLENINKAIDEAYIFLELSNDAMKNVVIDSQTYKYTGQEYMYLLSSYLTMCDVLKNQQNLLAQLRFENRSYETLMPFIKRSIAKMIFLSYLLEYQTQLYINIYHVGWPIQPPNHWEIMEYLKNVPDDIEGIRYRTEEVKKRLTTMTKMPREIAEKQKKAVLRHLREYENR